MVVVVVAPPSRSNDIRSAALELFARLGYKATTMSDIGAAVGMRAPSLYKHVASKQELLVQIMDTTMDDLVGAHEAALKTARDPVERFRRAVEAHVRYHARHRLEAFVGTREIRSLEEPHRHRVLARRAGYEAGFRQLITAGISGGCFTVGSARLASYSILDLGMGVAVWFREGAEDSEDAVVWELGEFALRLVGAQAPPTGSPVAKVPARPRNRRNA